MSTKEDQLLSACERGELKIIRELVERAEINPSEVVEKRDRSCCGRSTVGWTPLHYACACGHLEVAKFILVNSKQYDVNSQDKSGWTPLHWACREGHLQVVKYLVLNTKSDVTIISDHGKTPLHYASEQGYLEIVKFLLANSRADASAKDSDGWTPLHYASREGKLEVVKYLVKDCNVHILATDKWNKTPLTIARRYNHPQVVLCLLSSAIFSNENNITLQWACQWKHPQVVLWLLSNAKFSDNTVLSILRWACRGNHIKLVLWLISNVKFDDRTINAILLWARQKRHHEVLILLAEYGHKPTALPDPRETNSCEMCHNNFSLIRRRHQCHICWDVVCATCSKHKIPIIDLSSKPERVCDICFDKLSTLNENERLSADDLRILSIVLVEYLDKLKEVGLNFEVTDASQTTITKKKVVQCLQRIRQHNLADILAARQGIKDLQEYVYTNVYEKALQNEENEVRLQVFKMILSGVPRSGKTTFWKRLAMKDFQPSETSRSTGVAESHFLSAHMSTEMLLDLHLYSETDTSDLTTEALTIYKHILEAASTQADSGQRKSMLQAQPHSTSTVIKQESTSLPSKSSSTENTLLADKQTPSQTDKYDSNEKHAVTPATNQPSEDTNQISMNSPTESEHQMQKVSIMSQKADEDDLLVSQKEEIEQICKEIDYYFDELNSLLQKGEKLPAIPTIKKICHLIDTGGQRALLELLPTVTVGKALYLLFFSYEHFEKTLHETVQQKASPTEVHTGVFYEQMDIVMQSLICVSTTSSTSRDNVALLVGTHVDKVKSQHVECVNDIVTKKVEPFLKSGLVFAEKNKMVLEVSIKKNKRCSNLPEDYRKVIMNLVDNKLSCPESEKLPSSWYMFSIVLRRMKQAGRSVLQYSHCQQIARKLYIKEAQLQSLLSRLHKILGIVMYFPEVQELKDIIICDPSVVYRGISELIFNSFDETIHPELSLPLKKWGVFKFEELKEHCKVDKSYQLQIDKLLILLQHLGIIAPVQLSKSNNDSAELIKDKEIKSVNNCNVNQEFIIPCVLNDAQPEELKLQLRDGEACSIVPFRIYFKCEFSPMGGFCYLFTRLISDKKWRLPVEKEQMITDNKIYWRNKATFIVQADQKRYFVTLVSTKEYYEIHVVHTFSREPFQLGRDGHSICKKVWNDIEAVLSNSLNAPLKEYTVACQCILHGRGIDSEHIMEFESKPHESMAEVKANCLLDKSRPHPLTVDTSEQSIIVWFKEPRDCRTKDLGSVIELSMDHLFMATSSSDQIKYQWSVIIKGEDISEDEGYFKNRDSERLTIDCFESKLAGIYKCVISTSTQPVVSISAEVQLQLPEFPEVFNTGMSKKEFLLFINAKGISYKVCKKLKESEITANKFNLSSFESWSPHLNLTPMEMNEIRDLLAQISLSATHNTQADMKCPVCRNFYVDPCTLQCGHAVCQLCLALMYKNFDKFCPICKEPWKVFPAISYNYRANIERSYGQEVAQLRIQYTQEDKEVIDQYLKAKRSFSLESEAHVETEDLLEKPDLTFSTHLSQEQLFLWLCDHPRLRGIDYKYDIGKLKDARISANEFLTLKKDTLEQFGLSAKFHIPLMKIIEEEKEVHQKGAADGSPSQIKIQYHSYSSTDQQTLHVETKSDESTFMEPTSVQPAKTNTSEAEETDIVSTSLSQKSELAQLQLPQPFSMDMNHEDLEVWLSTHPQLVGVGFEQDISKLKDARISGRVLLNLNESRLEKFGISLGFQYTLLDIIETLRSQQSHDNESLPSRQQSTGCLSPNELRKVQDSLWEARVQWYNLGLGLDITPDTLDAIELANGQHPDRCFRAMLTKWLRDHEKPTWRALAEALRSPSISLGHLAEQILQKDL